MKNIIIVNMIEISKYFYQNIENKTQLERIIEYANGLPHSQKIIFLLSEDNEKIENKIILKDWNEENFIQVIQEQTCGFDHMFYFFADCPLLDNKISKIMYEDHINFYAEYTFADGYPYGLTPEIIDINILPSLNILTKGSAKKIDRNTIFNIVKKDINSFELETRIAEVDLRLLRVSLTTDTKRNYNQLIRIIKLGGTNAASITNILTTNSEILIQEPSFVTIEITKKSKQDVSYLPNRSVINDYINFDELEIITNKLKSYCDDTTVSFTPEYEPTTHPQLLEIIKLITIKNNFDLYIETSGLGWNEKLKKEIKENSKVNLIITLDALDTTIYHNIRGDGYLEATTFAKDMIKLSPERVWVQATRMKINEIDMEPFYRYWQEFTDNIIIQKYSNYNQSLPDLKVADLSPLKRFPCWHLKKDLHINTEGLVLLCFNDINSLVPLGSLLTEGIEEIMERKKEHYMKHIKCDYNEFCRKCDEYYTFNF